jgi:hypothetical protein
MNKLLKMNVLLVLLWLAFSANAQDLKPELKVSIGESKPTLYRNSLNEVELYFANLPKGDTIFYRLWDDSELVQLTTLKNGKIPIGVGNSEDDGYLQIQVGNAAVDVRLKTIDIPKPTVQLEEIATGLIVNEKGTKATIFRNATFQVVAIPNDDFARQCPRDVIYQIGTIEISLARGRKLIGATREQVGNQVDFSTFFPKDKPEIHPQKEDRFIIEAKQIKRVNHKGELEPVQGSVILAISLK